MIAGLQVRFEGVLASRPALAPQRFGPPLLQFRVSVDEVFPDDTRRQAFVHVCAVGELARQVAPLLHRGRRVAVEGLLKARSGPDREPNGSAVRLTVFAEAV